MPIITFIEPDGRRRECDAADGETILESALEAGIDYPFGCKSGNCGACKSELHSGEVQLAPYSEFALTEEEKERDLILACRAIPLSNCEVSPIGQDETVNHPHRSMNTEITNITKATHDIRILQMEISFGEILSKISSLFAASRNISALFLADILP